MSYDLVLRRRLSRDLSRGESPTPKHELAQVVIAVGSILLPHLLQRAEINRRRREYSTDTRGRLLRATIEIPVIPMRELVYGPHQRG